MSQSAVVRVYATTQEPDLHSPWQSESPTDGTGSGVVMSPLMIAMCSELVALSRNTRSVHSPPITEVIFRSTTPETRLSCRRRQAIRSEIAPIFRLCSWANFTRSGRRAMVPSSFMISQITPAGLQPARRAISTAASVWPARINTPPSRAFSGKI